MSVMIHICAGKILVQENIAPVDGYGHLVHIFKQRLTWHGTSRNHLYVKIEEYSRNEVRLCQDKLHCKYVVSFLVSFFFFCECHILVLVYVREVIKSC